ncbi:hypothetical protein PVAP13_2KG168516 [Panicum virgatum]|uniref:Uncharacterized protein n=1 Tax=Panicum virgatum TaxID=38727 RepID=A0A8T0WDC7_PANVG|nr:hypothetical protein PVAP13_2KG168516 [Panicum virgatum]
MASVPPPSPSPDARPTRVVRAPPRRPPPRAPGPPCPSTSTAVAARPAPRWTASAPRRSPRGTAGAWRAPGGSGTGRCPRPPRACSRCPPPTRTPSTPCSTAGPAATPAAISRSSSAYAPVLSS